jgi:hypothetical protein
MTDPVRQMLRDLGVSDKAIRVESFASPSRAVATAPGAIREKPTGATVTEATEAGEGGKDTVTFAR